jgi:uncharacterized membrane protein
MAMTDDPFKGAHPRHVEEAIKQIAAIHLTHQAESRPSERITDRAVSLIGTPTFFFSLFLMSSLWMLVNTAGLTSFDTPPFPMLELSCSVIAVLLAVLILAAQRRDDRLATRREQMTLQVGLLTEQKVSKLIELIEELRRDLPNVHNRVDLDAIEMTATHDHEQTLKTVEDALKPADMP